MSFGHDHSIKKHLMFLPENKNQKRIMVLLKDAIEEMRKLSNELI